VLYGSPDGPFELVRIAYACCRLMEPELVAETGVAHGFSTAAILQALEDNQKGRLISIDLPHLQPQAHVHIGSAVELRLRGRWRLHLGPASPGLIKVLGNHRDVDLFVQDASHTRRGQLAEYRTAWLRMKDGALLISDDVGPAFEAFAKEVGRTAIYVAQPSKRASIGILRR
jgi:predicted O-methyltransferase YrrM